MGYDKPQVKELLLQSAPSLEALARSIGQAESTRDAQHAAAVQFWRYAVELVAAGEVPAHVRAVADVELARHEAALAPIAPQPHRGYGPDGSGQPV